MAGNQTLKAKTNLIGRRTLKRARRMANIILSAFMTAEVAVAMILAAATAGAQLVGFETYDVLSGSMEPSIHTGSLVYVKTGIVCDLIRENDVIAFDIGRERTVMHRVVGINAQARTFTTKGDANEEADPQAVPWSSVKGTVVAVVPNLGSAISAFTARKEHFIVAIVAGNTLLCIAQRLLAEPQRNTWKGEWEWQKQTTERV